MNQLNQLHQLLRLWPAGSAHQPGPRLLDGERPQLSQCSHSTPQLAWQPHQLHHWLPTPCRQRLMQRQPQSKHWLSLLPVHSQYSQP